MLTLAACSGGGGSGDAGGESSSADSAATERAKAVEVDSLTPRIVLAHSGGVTTIDSDEGEVLGSAELEGYLRLGPAGDGRHVVIAGGDGFNFYDTGLQAEKHGDHAHYYAQEPALLPELMVEADHAGHIVPHGERTALFADGTGEITIFDNTLLADGVLGDPTVVSTPDPHHGVAVPLSGGGLLQTEGTDGARSVVVVKNADGSEVARTSDCPGVHGEAAAEPTESGDVITLGCENGPVVYRDGAFHKVPVQEQWQRSGNQKGHHDSPIVLADYKVEEDPEGGIEHPTAIGLIDTRNASIQKVELGSTYWFRSLERGTDGEALVLTVDGELNIIDPETGAMIHEVPVLDEWTEPEEWQSPAPMMAVADGTAYVVDPDNEKLVMVDIASGEISQELPLTVQPHEIQVATGERH